MILKGDYVKIIYIYIYKAHASWHGQHYLSGPVKEFGLLFLFALATWAILAKKR